MRIMADLIKADGVIDMREITVLDALKEKYGIRKGDDVAATSYSLSAALDIISTFPDDIKQSLIPDLDEVAMSDDFCAREEALLLMGLRSALTDKLRANISFISVCTPDFVFDNSQVIYVESEFDRNINSQIQKFYREICTELRLAGFELVYIPKVSAHYKSIPETNLEHIIEFLYPNVSPERLKKVIGQVHNLSTSDFCKNQLVTKFSMKELESVDPSFMIKIGESFVDGNRVTNFILVEAGDDALMTIRGIIDLFTENYYNLLLNYIRQERGRFIYSGFFKQILDILMLRRDIRSAVVLDPLRERIYFPDIDVKLDMIHRREKALYALFLLESESGGINFSRPASAKQLEKYNKRISTITQKYRLIYRMFGGDEDKAPNIESPEIRLPMISLLKRQMMKLDKVLYCADDYIIQRNVFGNYCVRIPPSLCYCCGKDKSDIKLLSESEDWRKISAL